MCVCFFVCVLGVPNFKILFQVCCWFASILFVPCVCLFGLCVDYAFWNCLVAFPCLWVCVCMQCLVFCSNFALFADFEICVCVLCYNRKYLSLCRLEIMFVFRAVCQISVEWYWHVVFVLFDFVLCVKLIVWNSGVNLVCLYFALSVCLFVSCVSTRLTTIHTHVTHTHTHYTHISHTYTHFTRTLYTHTHIHARITHIHTLCMNYTLYNLHSHAEIFCTNFTHTQTFCTHFLHTNTQTYT